MCLKCRDAHGPETVCNYISCANCRGKHPTDSQECKAVEHEKELRQRAIDQNISITHAKILKEQESTDRHINYANVGNKVNTRLDKLEERMEKMMTLIEEQGRTQQRLMELLEQAPKAITRKRGLEHNEEEDSSKQKQKYTPITLQGDELTTSQQIEIAPQEATDERMETEETKPSSRPETNRNPMGKKGKEHSSKNFRTVPGRQIITNMKQDNTRTPRSNTDYPEHSS